jgi:hypothetical protein
MFVSVNGDIRYVNIKSEVGRVDYRTRPHKRVHFSLLMETYLARSGRLLQKQSIQNIPTNFALPGYMLESSSDIASDEFGLTSLCLVRKVGRPRSTK